MRAMSAAADVFKPTDSFCDLTQGVSVAPKMGDALLWYNMQPANQGVTLLSKETRALHAAEGVGARPVGRPRPLAVDLQESGAKECIV